MKFHNFPVLFQAFKNNYIMPNMQIASNSISFPLFSVFTETWGCNND